jgi:hypothetical protein
MKTIQKLALAASLAAAFAAPAFAQNDDSTGYNAGGLTGVSTPWDRNAAVTGIQTWVTNAENVYNSTISEIGTVNSDTTSIESQANTTNSESGTANNTASSAYNLASAAQSNDNWANSVSNSANATSGNANAIAGSAESVASQAASQTSPAPSNAIVQIKPGAGCTGTIFVLANGQTMGTGEVGGCPD